MKIEISIDPTNIDVDFHNKFLDKLVDVMAFCKLQNVTADISITNNMVKAETKPLNPMQEEIKNFNAWTK